MQSAAAQQLEPRVYSPNPVGINFLNVIYARSDGGAVFDSTSPLQNVHATVNSEALAYGRSFDVLGRLTMISLVLPYASGHATGQVGAMQGEVRRSGLADAQFRVGVNLLGVPAMSPAEFASFTPTTSVGVSLTVIAPTGQYDPSRLVNISKNRWAFKPEFGVSYPTGHWFLEAYAGIWLFTDNEDYYLHTVRSESPMDTFQAHASYTIRRGLWVAADATYYANGTTSINGRSQYDRQGNTRLGLTLAIPLTARQSLKIAWSNGVVVRNGGDFSTIGISWQYLWF